MCTVGKEELRHETGEVAGDWSQKAMGRVLGLPLMGRRWLWNCAHCGSDKSELSLEKPPRQAWFQEGNCGGRQETGRLPQ